MSNVKAQGSKFSKDHSEIMECWNNGILLKSRNIFSQPDIPMFHHSILPHTFKMHHQEERRIP